MSEFFGRLETELRAAAERRPRRELPVPAIAVAVLLALAVAPIMLVLGSGDDTRAPEQRSGANTPERPQPLDIPGFPDAKIVATGTAPVAGPWEMFTYRSERIADPETGEAYQPAGLRCLGLRLVDPPSGHAGGLGGQCGEFPRTPGFSRLHFPTVEGARELLVYGRAPEEAASVRVTLEGRAPIAVEPIEGPPGESGDFYLAAVPPGVEGRVNWFDEDGNPGSVGHEVFSP
jgi:hypothetical protein